VTRRGFFKGLLGVTLAGLFSAVYGFFIEPAWRFRVRRWQVSAPDWPALPVRILAISDLHLGEPYVGLDRLSRIVARANALNADLVVLLGDYAAGHRFISAPVRIADAAPVLAGLRAKLGVFAILGNHDWWDDRTAQKRGSGPNLYATALEAAGIPVLSNRAVRVRDFWLAGLEDQLAHEPDIFPKVPGRVALTLSGHTHGGQLRLFGWSPVVPSRYGNRYAYGHVHEEGRSLVVSGGIGCSILPIRFGVPPEITLVELGPARA
jgi:predicted MPP superfamily phosphohydrolase